MCNHPEVSSDSVHETGSAAETEALAAALAAQLEAGDVVLLEGDLGAGKTTFVRAACRALGVAGPVTSPTFTIGRLYPADPDVAHIDLYRVGSLADEEPGLLDEYLGESTIAFVEWPRADPEELGRIAARVRIEHAGGDRRRIEVRR